MDGDWKCKYWVILYQNDFGDCGTKNKFKSIDSIIEASAGMNRFSLIEFPTDS